ncbi:MAG TPA: hypothetical protein VFV23_10410 [Verrucomicrobiae bacterium]|nr:hypothetical protein [Verrucomicrobiae bacterium]
MNHFAKRFLLAARRIFYRQTFVAATVFEFARDENFFVANSAGFFIGASDENGKNRDAKSHRQK